MLLTNFHLLFRPKTKFWQKIANFFPGEEDRMTSVDSNFNFLCGRPPGGLNRLTPLPTSCGRRKWMAPYVNRGRSSNWCC